MVEKVKRMSLKEDEIRLCKNRRIDCLCGGLHEAEGRYYKSEKVQEAVEKWLKYMKNDGGELSYRIHKDKFQQIFGVWEQ